MEIKNQKIQSFTDLKVWQEGHKLIILIYRITNKLTRRDNYSLIDQIRRASVSVTSNIAEGFGRHSYKEKVQYYYQAKGSLTELKNQVIIMRDVTNIDKDIINVLLNQANIVDQLLQGLIKKSKTFI